MPEPYKQTVLILGGARSGKSSLAQQMARESGLPVVYLATGVITDVEMKERVQKHRESRPQSWVTKETPYGGFGQMNENWSGKAVLLDCITFLVNNLLLREDKEEVVYQQLLKELGFLFEKHQQEGFYFLIVSNETGMGIVPEYPLARTFRDLQGRINQWLASRANHVYMVLAGIPVRIKGEE
ncbi:MAG: bifunctional adenosylcobinamide kinase/adenosylcobinamide-phosphate guanylyltransferase [Candidatus Atribacteria bacterium]|nr:bifunctional adenosylcobinamide kinase/adenosylcobinamide-phosphate guanylyltransferase [Candidatus Atribacteria bacterium]